MQLMQSECQQTVPLVLFGQPKSARIDISIMCLGMRRAGVKGDHDRRKQTGKHQGSGNGNERIHGALLPRSGLVRGRGIRTVEAMPDRTHLFTVGIIAF
jgi:hypothetical protein